MDINSNITGLRITQEMETLLNSIAKWARFLSILIFIYLGLTALSILFAGVLITGMNSYEMRMSEAFYTPGVFSWGYATALLLMLAIYSVPTYFLFKFSTNLKKALIENDNLKLTVAIQFLQRNYKFIGILAIIMITAFIVMFMVMMGAALFGR